MRADIEQKSIDILQKCVPCGAAAARRFMRTVGRILLLLFVYLHWQQPALFVRPPYLYSVYCKNAKILMYLIPN